jgi:hypothetical protein
MTTVMRNEGWKAKQHLARLVTERDEQTFRKLIEQRVGKAVAARAPWVNEDRHQWLSKKLAQPTLGTGKLSTSF